ncbi:MAG: IPT/TIG domain-containing protein, partial [Prevotellaceae bacterium]|nr:IPT/TIG domain-containing protein [Prevotellaceae bacterium]
LPAASGGWIRIFSADAFPYASTDEYIQDGLVAHYDGINNQNINDKMHSSDVVEWKDISGNGYDVKLRKGHSTQTREEAIPVTNITQCSGARWDSNGFFFKDYCYFAKVPADPDATDALYNIMPNLPYGNDNYTIESVFDPTSREALNGGIVGWGEQTDYQACSVRFHNMSDNAKPKFRNSWWGSDVSAEFTDPGSTNIKNVAVTYDNDALAFPYHRIFYYNGTTNSIAYIDPNCPSGGTTHICREKTNKNTSKRGSFFVGQSVGVNTNDNAPDGVSVYTDNMNRYSNGNKLFSVRVYNRALTPIQIENNYNVDKLRFEAPPIVRVDGKQCTNVTVLSPRVITCQVPPGTAGIVDIEVRTADDASQILWLDDEFTYQ